MVTDRDVKVGDFAGLVAINVGFAPAVSQTGLEVRELIMPARYEIHSVQTYCRAKAGTVTADVRIDGVTALAAAAAFTAGAAVQATLATDRAARRGTAAKRVTIHATTDGTGAVTDGALVLWIRGYPAATE